MALLRLSKNIISYVYQMKIGNGLATCQYDKKKLWLGADSNSYALEWRARVIPLHQTVHIEYAGILVLIEYAGRIYWYVL